jgi:hypothetical protein
MRTENVEITPAIAQEWLDREALDSRKPSAVTVAKYAGAMRDGRWVEPGIDAVAFDPDGRRLNGTHRLMAIIASGVTVVCLVAYDVPSRMLYVADGQRRRSASQFATGTYRKERVATARLLIWYDAGSVVNPSGGALQFDNDVLLGIIDGPLHDVILRSVQDASAAAQLSGVPAAVHAAVLTIARRESADPYRLEGWLFGLRDGLQMGLDDPRRHLMRRMTGTHSQQLRRDTAAVWMLTVRAFNAWLGDRPMKALKFESGDAPPRHSVPKLGRRGLSAGLKPAPLARNAYRWRPLATVACCTGRCTGPPCRTVTSGAWRGAGPVGDSSLSTGPFLSVKAP